MAQPKINNTSIISKSRYTLKKINFDIQKKDGSWHTMEHEVYDRGNAVAALLYNKEQRTIILTKQFRIATYINGNPSGMLVEVCAGLLEENEDPAKAMIREIEEETGYKIDHVQKVYEAYTSAGGLTEKIFLFIAEYKKGQKVGQGGGLEEEQEDVEVVEISFDEATQMLNKGDIKDAKTIILLQYAQLKQLL
jgi:nudix-type nucleoside diphosphatase (YffH/AdpP family)